MELDRALELLHSCPSIGFSYDCKNEPVYTIKQKDLPVLFDYIQKQNIKHFTIQFK